MRAIATATVTATAALGALVAIGAVSHSLWAGALAGGLALGAMLLTRTAHSPAAATAVIGAMSTGSPGAFVACTAAAATVLVGFGLLGSALRGPAYPRYWW